MPTWTHIPNHPRQSRGFGFDEYCCGAYRVKMFIPPGRTPYLEMYGPEGSACLYQWPAVPQITNAMLQRAVEVLVVLGADPKDLP